MPLWPQTPGQTPSVPDPMETSCNSGGADSSAAVMHCDKAAGPELISSIAALAEALGGRCDTEAVSGECTVIAVSLPEDCVVRFRAALLLAGAVLVPTAIDRPGNLTVLVMESLPHPLIPDDPSKD